jgi:hypothetical protein
MKIKQQIFAANEPLTFPLEILGVFFFSFLNDDTILKKMSVFFLKIKSKND